MSFETQSILQDSRIWFQGGLLNIGGVRKFYQFQSRLIQNGFPNLFGTKIHEIYFQLTFALASSIDNGALPDLMGTISRAHSSPASLAARKTVAEIGEFVGNSGAAQAFENGIISYAQAAIELDVQLLEHVRDEICAGLDAFDRVAEVIKGYPGKEKQALYKIASVLMRYLERIAERLESYYTDHAALSLYNAAKEANPARARWNLLRRRISDGSFFVLTRQIGFTDDLDDVGLSQPTRGTRTARSKRQTVTFDQVLSQAVSSVTTVESRERRRLEKPKPSGQSDRLAAAHTQRAGGPTNLSSSYEEQSVTKANKRMSTFIQNRLKDIRRLSRSDSTLNLEHALAAYGVSQDSKARSQFTDTDSDSGISMHTGDELQPQPRGAQRMKPASRLRSETSSSTRSSPTLPEPRPTAPLKVPNRSVSARSDHSSSQDVSLRGLRSVRPGSIAESQQRYRRSPVPSVDARRINLRKESLMKLSGESDSNMGDAEQDTPLASHW
ncbi:hypothetical protein FS749_014417 [Ceratobasidium sp. UAMH 11750]|nr:hypothetical protein FS749_014417 [Ceratobasidium sp. UAMH 11750]